MYNKNTPTLQKPVTIADLTDLGQRAADVLSQVREEMLQPHPRKSPPTFSSAQIRAICNLDKTKFNYLCTKNNLPLGTKKGNGRSTEYSLEELFSIVNSIGNRYQRPSSQPGFVMAVCNYKGGVAKTGTVVALAQALTQLGRKVLLIDADPQGSATQLLGIAPDADVTEAQTLMPFIHLDERDLDYAIQKTYWANLDLIPASSALFVAEFSIPANRMKDKTYKFWDLLTPALIDLRKRYDVILFDTSPSLSYMTINSLFAADGLVMPCPPDALDFASSTQFWRVFSELGNGIPEVKDTKTYDFVGILPTKVKDSRRDPMGVSVKGWMSSAYGHHMLPLEIPESSAASLASSQYKTIFDLTKPDGSMEAYTRFKEPLERLANYIDDQITHKWRANNV